MDIDSYREILDTITRNKSRSFLTGFGVFWGVFMLVALIGGGQGLKELLQKNFDGFASNSAAIWAQSTSKAYKGFRKGRQWNMNDHDVERLRQQVPELETVSPQVFAGSKTAVREDQTTSVHVKGVTSIYADVYDPDIRLGRYLNEMDERQLRKVCVIGQKVYEDLFPEGGDPCGKRIRIDSVYYSVVGVDYRSSGGINIGGRNDESVTLPLGVFRRAYNRGVEVDNILVTGRGNVRMSSLTQRMREVVARAHSVSPDDTQGVIVFNTELMFSMIDNLFRGVNLLIWLVGMGTLLAGAIGVSNIMMVTVRERTTEIGIRRAIGATPRMILSQILSESVVLTLVAGMLGVMMGVAVLQLLEMANTTDGIVNAHFQVNFWTALLASVLVSVLGVLAGLAPAWRAMSIKPVDAMRDE